MQSNVNALARARNANPPSPVFCVPPIEGSACPIAAKMTRTDSGMGAAAFQGQLAIIPYQESPVLRNARKRITGEIFVCMSIFFFLL
ncbi:hypothetical protein CEXT_287201 [Caerostris extrusa]|uniref:Uncharacterized protein n=1 Tax=Caerostris extrusa TaxID=172846 RepID=A0AAV4NXU5_CAEEX|nr:hypothetical protein CEXT_287201 [Caerostris extrusa]